MEKFTVDLDKVLDEFEFNEEQAFHQENFRNEDLPAKRYQKPHFQPINMADADFSPSIETTVSFLPFNRKHSQDPTNSSTASGNASINCRFNDVNHKVLSDLIEAPVITNFQIKKGSLIQNEENNEKAEFILPTIEGSHEISKSEYIFEKQEFIDNDGGGEIKDGVKVQEQQRINKDNDVEVEEVEKEHGAKTEAENLHEAEAENEHENVGANTDTDTESDTDTDTDTDTGTGTDVGTDTETDTVEDEDEDEDVNENEGVNVNEDTGIDVVVGVDEIKSEKENKEENENEKNKENENETSEENENKNRKEFKEKHEEADKDDGIIVGLETGKEKINEVGKIEIESGEKHNNDKKGQCEANSITVDSPSGKLVKIGESQSKPDLTENECNITQQNTEDILKLPNLTDVKKENFQENINCKVDNYDLINSKNSEGVKITGNMCENKNEQASSLPNEDSQIGKTNIQPIRFECQNNITDEDLHRYLEELEEEEEEQERKKLQVESKPVRPDTLNLSEENESEKLTSPGFTPLPRDDNTREGNEVEDFKEDTKESTRSKSQYEEKPEQNEQNEVLAGTSPNVKPYREPLSLDERRLGKVSPFWMPDHFASCCMDCDSKFTVIKRRHHCRACGRILCSKCCGMRASLEYLKNEEHRVCNSCFLTLAKVMMYELQCEGEHESSPARKPNPNNPMEYCSTVPPPLQVSSSSNLSPPSVLVPVGVLKREGTAKGKENPKQVMFSDGIRPGGDLTDLDGSADQRRAFRRAGRANKRAGTPPGSALLSPVRMLPPIDPKNQSFIPEKGLPPVCVVNKGETTYQEYWPHDKLIERLKDQSQPPLTFALNRHLIVSLKIVKLDCCMDETCWAFCTKGMECVGQDEILILLTLKDENDDVVPKDVLFQLHYIYQEAAKGNTIGELGYWTVLGSNFLESPQHGGFLFIRPTFQCLNHIDTPRPPFLVGVLIHKSEIPWARVFPIRLMLRLGAEFRYYPSPLVSVRFREPVYFEIGHTIINVLADFRDLTYMLPNVRGLRIHIEPKQASILIPRNRYDQIIRALNNSNEPVLALAGNFSQEADAHLVAMRSKGDEITYKTQTININDKPRKVTGASFVVLNGALKSTSGVLAKSSYVEDGLLVQVPNETMTVLRNKLRNMEDWSVKCGPVENENNGTEDIVRIVWCEDDKNFNIGVKSVIDDMPLDGVPSVRTHNFEDCMGSSKFIRWTQVFIIKCEEGATSAKIGDPLEINKLSENIASATCIALKKLLDLLAASGLTVIGVRATIDQDNVGYEAGSNGEKLPPIYMNSLDDELIPVLHKAASLNDSVAVLELVFHIMEQ